MGFYHTGTEEHFIIWVPIVQFFPAKLSGGEPVQESNCCQYITISLDCDIALWKNFTENLAEREGGESPILSPRIHVSSRYLANAMRGHEQYSAGFENPMECLYRGSETVNKLQSLREDDAIEAV